MSQKDETVLVEVVKIGSPDRVVKTFETSDKKYTTLSKTVDRVRVTEAVYEMLG